MSSNSLFCALSITLKARPSLQLHTTRNHARKTFFSVHVHLLFRNQHPNLTMCHFLRVRKLLEQHRMRGSGNFVEMLRSVLYDLLLRIDLDFAIAE
jgi:hypothetical protein